MSLAVTKEQIDNRRRRRFTVAEYERVWGSGVFSPAERTELIEGDIIHVTPMGSRHSWTITNLLNVLVIAGNGKYLVASQIPVPLDTRNEPEPDVVVLKKTASRAGHPQISDILLLVEVCDTSVDYDREVKLPMYARNGVPEVWLVDCASNEVEVYREPGRAGYAKHATIGSGEELRLSQVRGVAIKAAEFLR